jgi:RimJ/RimL family protein N-acetyltransferase
MFESPRYVAREMPLSGLPRLQALFEANPELFLITNGRRPETDEAQQHFDELPPPHLSYSRRWFAGVFDRTGELQGHVAIVSDLVLPGAWHVATFLMATRLHGSGAATETFAALESWMRSHGASWLRLGVVAGNARAERFWERCGFVEVRRRENMDTGGRINTMRIMVKPLAGLSLAHYLELVPRDRPDSALP